MGGAQERSSRRQHVALAVLAGIGLLLLGRLMMSRPRAGTPILLATPVASSVFVHVTGEVLVPGLYRLPPGARWSDAVRAARGATFLADLAAINLAQPLRDGERVFVPRRIEPAAADPAEGETAGSGGGGRRGTRAGDSASPSVRPVDLNTASAPELEALPGIGPVLARRIVEYRRTHGRFTRVEELQEVEGVGSRVLERLRPLLRVR